MAHSLRRLVALSPLLFIAFTLGCSNTPGDPFEKINRPFYNFNEALDRHAVKPAANFYEKIIPLGIRTGLGNGFSNLGYLNVIINDYLQGKWQQGLSDTGRMAVNSTVGIAGFFDVATGWGMPIHENRLGTTLGKWGVPPGPYLVIPVLGPSTVRDAPGFYMASITNPVYWIRPGWEYTVPLSIFYTLDARTRLDFLVRFRNEQALDPYVFTRDAYLQYTNTQIRGPATKPSEDFYNEDLDDTTKPTGK